MSAESECEAKSDQSECVCVGVVKMLLMELYYLSEYKKMKRPNHLCDS